MTITTNLLVGRTSSAITSVASSLTHPLRFVLFLLAALVAAAPVSAQTPVGSSCFPTCSDVDARFLSIAGTNLSTLTNSEVILKIGSPAGATSVEIGIFDGETGGMWDFGTTALQYTLYADPTGQGTGTTVIATWSAGDMLDNLWKTFTVPNAASAKAANGNYLYRLVVTSTDPLASYMSNFKVRTDGTVALKAQAFTVAAAAITVADLNVVYPAGWTNVTPATPTTYDGRFDFYLNVDTKGDSLTIWDGDMDFGSFDCSIRDVDDINTSNTVLPPWATPLIANLEGVGFGDPCAIGTGFSTGTPPDDFGNPRFRRIPNVNYTVKVPGTFGPTLANGNPSGSREWERFRIATGPVNTLLNDAQADSLPAGIYRVRVEGMDLSNLNGWRFFFDALGVDIDGDPPPTLLPYDINGIVSLDDASITVSSASSSSTGNGKGKKKKNNDDDEQTSATSTASASATTCGDPLENVGITLVGDLNGDGVIDLTRTTTTGANGRYSFPGVNAGNYRVFVTTSTLPFGANPVNDFDGVATPNVATVVIAAGALSGPGDVFFCYAITGDGTGGVRTQGYWKNHPNNWPVSKITIGCVEYTRDQAIAKMKTSVAGDKTYSMFYQLVAAKLNVLSGAKWNCIASTISAADDWMCANPLGSNVSSSSSAWTNGADDWHEALDQYNNGKSCASHID